MDMYQKRKMRAEKKNNDCQGSFSKAVISWFPGHMAKAERYLKEDLKKVDMVVEVLDSRIPLSSQNPDLDKIINNKPKIIVLNKSDLSDEKITSKWIEYFKNLGNICIPFSIYNLKNIEIFKNNVKILMNKKLENQKLKGFLNPKVRIMIVGIPNVGKSSLINKISKNKKAKVENRPGVTRRNQWFSAGDCIEILDTPGVLWPKFENETVAYNLSFTGAIKDNVLDVEDLAQNFINETKSIYYVNFSKRFKLSEDVFKNFSCESIIEEIARKRGMILPGGDIDKFRVSKTILEEYRSGKLGKITLEIPENFC